MQPTFFQVARRPKWIGVLLLMALVAAVFAGLMQWQLSRTFTVVGISEAEQEPRPLSEFAIPGEVFPNSFDRLATVEVELDKENANIVSNRIQLRDGQQVNGYWLIVNSEVVENEASLTLAIAFSEDPTELSDFEIPEGKLLITGYVEPSEPVRDGEEYLGSVALSELVNRYFAEPTPSYPIYLIVQSGIETDLERIEIGIQAEQVEINWLTAFYAIEWLFFAVAAFYLWWRLVQDQVLREREIGESN
jgi:surfeit locus 1 family protein